MCGYEKSIESQNLSNHTVENVRRISRRVEVAFAVVYDIMLSSFTVNVYSRQSETTKFYDHWLRWSFYGAEYRIRVP